jgi:molybdopterin converting factor small subunit
MGLLGAAFARCLGESGLPGEVVAPALAGWNKYLSVQLHLMDMGYRAALEFERGEFPVAFTLFGRLRLVAGQRMLTAAASPGETMESLLRRFFNYVPELRADCLRPVWHSHERIDSSWVEIYEAYAPAPGGWRFLLNGRNAAYADGFSARIQPEDTISIFPPGR